MSSSSIRVNLSAAGAHDEIMLCLLAATGELLKHNTLQARIVVQAIPREAVPLT